METWHYLARSKQSHLQGRKNNHHKPSITTTAAVQPAQNRSASVLEAHSLRHLVAMSSHHPSQQCCVWDSYKYNLYTKFREPKLYRYAAQGDWDLIPQRCKTHPKEATFVHKYAPMDTPLNRLLEQDDSCNILLMLMERAPQAVHMVDIERRTPLHYLVARNERIPLKFLAKMVALCPEALSVKDEVGETPVDIIQSRKDELSNVDELTASLLKLQSMLSDSTKDVLKNVRAD